MTEREKMEAGEWYDANFDPELIAVRARVAASFSAFASASAFAS